MDKLLLEQFSKPIDDTKAQEFYNDYALPIVCNALSEVSKKIELISPDTIKIFPMGEYANKTAIDETGGEIELVIASSNPQLQLSNNTYQKEYVKASKKEKSQVNIKNTSEEIIKALFNALLPEFSEKTSLVLYAHGIKVLCKEECGFNMLIRFATYNENDDDMLLSFWNTIKKQSETINLFQYSEAVEAKDKKTKGNYSHIVRIFKSFRKTMLANKWISANGTTRYFVEALIYNVPTKLLMGTNIEEVYTKVMMYIQNCPLTKLQSFDNKPINKCNLIKASYSTIKTFINYIPRLDV